MVLFVALLAIPVREAIYIGGRAEAAEIISGALCFLRMTSLGVLLVRVCLNVCGCDSRNGRDKLCFMLFSLLF